MNSLSRQTDQNVKKGCLLNPTEAWIMSKVIRTQRHFNHNSMDTTGIGVQLGHYPSILAVCFYAKNFGRHPLLDWSQVLQFPRHDFHASRSLWCSQSPNNHMKPTINAAIIQPVHQTYLHSAKYSIMLTPSTRSTRKDRQLRAALYSCAQNWGRRDMTSMSL